VAAAIEFAVKALKVKTIIVKILKIYSSNIIFSKTIL
jgi:hypothetical protein